MVRRAFSDFCSALGTEPAMNVLDKGKLSLENVQCYGGYQVVRLSHGGGQETLFGSERRPAREMFNTLRFATAVLKFARA